MIFITTPLPFRTKMKKAKESTKAAVSCSSTPMLAHCPFFISVLNREGPVKDIIIISSIWLSSSSTSATLSNEMQRESKENKCILELLGNFGVAKAIYFPRGKYSCQPFSFLKNTFLLLPYFPAYWKKTYQVFCQWLSKFPFPKFYIFPPDILNCFPKCRIIVGVKRTWILLCTPSQLAELSRSEFDQESFSHSAYDKFFVTFATTMPYLTFCNQMR